MSIITDANHEHDHLSERTTNTALIPEVSHTIAPTISRTATGRQRTSASNHSNHSTPNVANISSCHSTSSGAVCCGHIYTSRTKDYYVFALRHIII